MCSAVLDTPVYNGHTTAVDALWGGWVVAGYGVLAWLTIFARCYRQHTCCHKIWWCRYGGEVQFLFRCNKVLAFILIVFVYECARVYVRVAASMLAAMGVTQLIAQVRCDTWNSALILCWITLSVPTAAVWHSLLNAAHYIIYMRTFCVRRMPRSTRH